MKEPKSTAIASTVGRAAKTAVKPKPRARSAAASVVLSASAQSPVRLEPSEVAPAAKGLRSDGSEARNRLLNCALNLFSKNGFSKTSTREIATAAAVNIAAISYYFGDKAGLYRAVFTEPLGSPSDDIHLYDQPHFTLRESLNGFFTSFLEPLKQGELVQQCMRLHYREMLEPTGLWAQELEYGIKPAHMALANTLQRHMGLSGLDDELHRLTFAVTALALHLFICDEVIVALTPQLRNSPQAIDLSAQRLADFAQAMVVGEMTRRAGLQTALSSAAPAAPAALASTVRAARPVKAHSA